MLLAVGAGRLPMPLQQSPLTLIPPATAPTTTTSIIRPNSRGLQDPLQQQEQPCGGAFITSPPSLREGYSSIPPSAAGVAVLEGASLGSGSSQGVGGAPHGSSINSIGSSSLGGTLGSTNSGGSGGLQLDPALMATFAPSHTLAQRAPSSSSPVGSGAPPPSYLSPPGFIPGAGLCAPHLSTSSTSQQLSYPSAHHQLRTPRHHQPPGTAPVSRQHTSEAWPEQQQQQGEVITAGELLEGWLVH